MSLNATSYDPTLSLLPNFGAVMEVYVINMAQSVQRWSYMQDYLRQKGIEPTRIDAIDGRALSVTERLRHYDKSSNEQHYFLPLKAAEIGCFLSHKKTTSGTTSVCTAFIASLN